MKESFTQLVKTRQSCRDFNDVPLEKKVVLEIAEQAMLAPSACNSQPWKMYVVTDEQKLKEVGKALQDGGHNKFTQKAKAFIVVSEKDATLKESISTRFNRWHFVKYDIGELIAYITLTAESMGVKSCIIGWVNQAKLKAAVDMPQSEIANLVVALGYSDCPVREKKRKDVSDVITVL